MDINRKQQQVLNVMRAIPETVNDNELLLAVFWAKEWQEKGNEINYLELYRMLKSVTHAETITRRARELVEMKLVELDPTIASKRRTAANNETNAHTRIANPSGLDDYTLKDNKEVVNDEVKQRLEALDDTNTWQETVGKPRSNGDGYKKFMATKEMMKLKGEKSEN